MLKIEVADFQDEEAFNLDLKMLKQGLKPRGAAGNSISIRLTSGAAGKCVVSRCLAMATRPAHAGTPARHSKTLRRAYPVVKPCRPCRVGKVGN